MAEQYEISAVISTYNRSRILGRALESMLGQQSDGVSYEVIVVDNNSTDATREVVESFLAQGHSNLSYLFEPRQGVSYTRNRGIAAACAPVIAFADDDVQVAKDWIANIKRTFDQHPEIDCIGGKVLPRWQTPPPRWLTRDHWMPLALLDYGEEPFCVGPNKRLCLVSANLALRRHLLAETGLFAPELQRAGDNIGSVEDVELLERIWQTGRECLYTPRLVVTAEVPEERMTKDYHRRWHTGHGHFFAIMRSEEMEQSFSRLFDVPAHLYRQVVADAAAWLKYSLAGKRERAFAHETGIRFFSGFFRKRRQDFLNATEGSASREIARFIRSLISKKSYRNISKEIG